MESKEVIANTIEVAAKTALSVVPVGGALLTNVWDAVKSNAAQKRLCQWQSLIESRLHTLEMSLEEIGSNELFTTAIMSATEMAIKTAEDKKKEYLANIVLKSIIVPIDESRLLVYLDLTNHLTATHLLLLQFFRDPSLGGKNKTDSYYIAPVSQVLKDSYPSLCQDMSFVTKVIKDLQNDGLIADGSWFSASMTNRGILESRTTKLGNDYLNYIID